jgi:hypothetical protein
VAETLIARDEAIHILSTQRAEVLALIARLPAGAGTEPGLGGGDWSPKDLLGHLESWEEHVLAALEAWSRGKRAPIDAALRGGGLDTVNAREVARKARRPFSAQLTSTIATRERLVMEIRDMTDERWASMPTTRRRESLGYRVGQILAGTDQAFRHDEAHLPDLREFADDHRHV